MARYGGRQTVTVLPGDGIGPEMFSHVQKVFDTATVPVDFEMAPLRADLTIKRDEDFENAIISIQRNGVALKGNIETKLEDPHIPRNMELRSRLKLFANIVHCVSIPTVPSRHNDLDIVMIRENTEGEYSGLEHSPQPGVVESLKIATKVKIEQIVRFAFDYAVKYNRTKVTAVHKANIQKLGDGLFLKIATEMKEQYPQIQFQSMIVDNASMQLVSRPQQFNGGIMLMPNLYGNIISNIACGLVGGPGLVSGMNIGEKYAIFETATRNTGTAISGKNIANPTAFFRASCDMLRYLGLDNYANFISDALFIALTEQGVHTKDIGGTAKTSDLVEAVIKNINAEMKKQKHIKFYGI
uniref:Isocitrate dehydrogenase [NAD] subunit, mitochondrial n=1 Tax=Acrobeloides nanus TaxID=290746 RepID=A0A914DP30_9BILA